MLRRRHFSQTQTPRKTKRRQAPHEARRPGGYSARSLPRRSEGGFLFRRRVELSSAGKIGVFHDRHGYSRAPASFYSSSEEEATFRTARKARSEGHTSE